MYIQMPFSQNDRFCLDWLTLKRSNAYTDLNLGELT